MNLASQKILRGVLLLGSTLFVSLLSVNCGGSGGGSGSSGGSFGLLAIATGEGSLLPTDGVFLNESIIFSFSQNIDPSSVSDDAIQIRRRRIVNGQPSGNAFAVPARGTFVVREKTIEFVPRLPTRSDFADAGYSQGTLYRVDIESNPAFDSVRSLGGDPLEAPVRTSFSTRNQTPLLADPSPGPPSVLAVGLDLNQDGEIDADGLPETVDTEEFFGFEATPFLIETPVGLAKAPLIVSIIFSEPLLPETVFADEDGDGEPDHIALVIADTQVRLATKTELIQELDPSGNRFFVRVILTPKSTLPPGTRIEPRVLPGLQDFASPPFSIDAFSSQFETEFGPAQFNDALVETFNTRDNIDFSSTAAWNIANSNALEAGAGIGGNGIDGAFIVPRGEVAMIDTRVNNGFFNFSKITLEDDSVLEVIGPNPLSLFSTGDVTLSGIIDVSGTDGESAIGLARNPAGGIGIAGATNGGPAGRFEYVLGAGPEGVGGGQGGISAGSPGGGGGGGHARIGGSQRIIQNQFPGLGGSNYGTTDVRPFYAGSGGGGGGNVLGTSPLVRGGGGGAGGGGISIDTAGAFTLTTGGRIIANAGNGGNGDTGAPFGGGGGGGGSGGAIRIRAASISPLINPGSELVARGGVGGAAGGGTIGPGAGGSEGRVFIETPDANADGQANDFVFDTDAVTISPPLTRGVLSMGVGESFALSQFMDTGTTNARFSFDASNPKTGEITFETVGGDLVLREEIPEDTTVHILFQGAPEDPVSPQKPDFNALSDFTSRVEDLNGLQFIRYRIDFDIGDDLSLRPVIEDLQIRFTFDI